MRRTPIPGLNRGPPGTGQGGVHADAGASSVLGERLLSEKQLSNKLEDHGFPAARRRPAGASRTDNPQRGHAGLRISEAARQEMRAKATAPSSSNVAHTFSVPLPSNHTSGSAAWFSSIPTRLTREVPRAHRALPSWSSTSAISDWRDPASDAPDTLHGIHTSRKVSEDRETWQGRTERLYSHQGRVRSCGAARGQIVRREPEGRGQTPPFLAAIAK
jgi:hypothetical protein